MNNLSITHMVLCIVGIILFSLGAIYLPRPEELLAFGSLLVFLFK